jgi:elongation factor P
MVSINTETELPLSVDMPPSVVLEVTYAEPGIREYSYNATKSATVETGATVSVPLMKEIKLKLILHQVLIWNV